MEHEGDSCPSKAFNPNKIENKLKAMKKRNNSVPNDSKKKMKLQIRKKPTKKFPAILTKLITNLGIYFK